VGNYILAAVSERKTTSINAYDLAEGEHIMVLRGHRGVIYSMEASPNEKLLVTAGSDNIVRVLNLP
jgi:WD40 repeat protein